jgi:signal transduction histidine kinase
MRGARVKAPAGRRRRLLTGAVAGVLFAVLALVEVYGDPRADDTRPAAVGLSGVLSLCFPLAVWYPITAMTVAMLSFPYAMVTGAEGVGGAQLIAELVLVAHAAYRGEPRRSLIASFFAATVPAVALVWGGEGLWEFVFFGALVGAAWSLGALLRREKSRSRQLAALAAELAVEREARARAAVNEERARISRELHDAVAHTVSVMTMQAGVVRRRLADRPVERDALEQVEQLGRRSVTELRRVVGLLRPEDAVAAQARRPGGARTLGGPRRHVRRGRHARRASGRARHVRVPDRAGGVDECATPRQGGDGDGDRGVRAGRRQRPSGGRRAGWRGARAGSGRRTRPGGDA